MMERNEAEKRLRNLLWVIECLPENTRIVEVDTVFLKDVGPANLIHIDEGIEAAAAGLGQTVRRERCNIPKGTDLGKIRPERVWEIENWINNYPRKILGWRTSAELFEEFLEGL